MNNFQSRRRLVLQAGIASAALGIRTAAAQSPMMSEVTRLVCPAPPGSVLDLFCRRVADSIQPGYSRNVIVENRTGAAGQIAVMAVKNAPADGATVLVTPMPQMGIFPHTYRKLAYDPLKDFAPISLGATTELAFAVGPLVPPGVKSMADFAAWCKTNPSKAHFGSPASGSTPHFAGLMAARAAGAQITHVPYRGTSPVVVDLIAGQVSAGCLPVGEFLPFVNSGKCRMLGTTGAKRSQFAPDVPTFVEQGYPDVVMNDWVGVFVPVKTPATQVQKLSAALRGALSRREVIAALAEKGQIAAWSTPAELTARLRADLDRWGPIVSSIGFTADS